MKTALQFSALVASVLLVLPTAAFGAENPSPQMQSAMNKVTCDTTMLAGFVNDMIAKIPSATSLNQNLNKINSDTKQLQNYAKSDDKANFDSYLKDTYQKDAKSLTQAVHNLIKSSTVDKSVKDELRTALDSRQSEDQKCISGVLKMTVDVKNQKSPNQITTKDKSKTTPNTEHKIKDKSKTTPNAAPKVKK